MRIIGGELRGRRISAPPGRGTRPMLDRVREALFSRLQLELPGARILDLFAGSGSLGLEALSRGAERVRLVERDPAVVALLRSNVQALGLDERAEVVRGDALAPGSWAPPGGRGPGWDVAFFDSPFPLLEHPDRRQAVLSAARELATSALRSGGVLVLHVPRGSPLGEAFHGIEAETRTYGGQSLWFLRAGGPHESPPGDPGT